MQHVQRLPNGDTEELAARSLRPPVICSFCNWHWARFEPVFFAASGMDFFVCLERPGFRITRRRRCKTRLGVQHRVTKEDSIKW